jgi:hypothetical protein
MDNYKKLPALGSKIIGKMKNGRPVVLNEDGSVSTERTETIRVDGGFMNIPTMFGGKAVDVKSAIEIIRNNGFKDPETGETLKTFPDPEKAVQAAQKRSKGHSAEVNAILKKAGVLNE